MEHEEEEDVKATLYSLPYDSPILPPTAQPRNISEILVPQVQGEETRDDFKDLVANYSSHKSQVQFEVVPPSPPQHRMLY